MNIEKTIYPKNQLSENEWMKKYKVSSRYEKPNIKKMYQEGEYDKDKFIKMIKNYGTKNQPKTSIQQIRETLSLLRNWKVQEAWNKINFA